MKKSCIYCESEKVVKNGKHPNGHQRYECKECKKGFCETTGTPEHYMIKREKFKEFKKLIYSTVRSSSSKLRVNKDTTLSWRHKLASTLRDKTNPKELIGIVEVDDVWFARTELGKSSIKIGAGDNNNQVKVIFCVDRYKNVFTKLVKCGRINKNDLDKAIGNLIDAERNIMVSDCHNSLISFGRSIGVKHEALKVSAKEYVRDKVYHVNTLNSFVGRFNTWLYYNYRVVSTKYLEHYLWLFKMKDKEGFVELLEEWSVVDSGAWDYYHGAEKRYQAMLKK